jgi:putative MFS transporter
MGSKSRLRLILIAINTVIYGFVAWVPTFLVKQGMSIVSSLGLPP